MAVYLRQQLLIILTSKHGSCEVEDINLPSFTTQAHLASLIMSAVESSDFMPRRYQEEIFSRSQKENIIAVLNTGSGKTLISLMLIKWTASLEESRGKSVVFLVPNVSLVKQQSLYLAERTTLKVEALHGELELDLGDRLRWMRRFSDSDVLVMTAQIFLNTLTHSLWTIDKVSLLIFDECHHARRDHPYNGILNEYFQAKHKCRPKIFGMTASPIWKLKGSQIAISILEKAMDAKVIVVSDNVKELAEHSPKANELIKIYPTYSPCEVPSFSPTIHQCLTTIDEEAWQQFDIPWRKIDARYSATLKNIGLYCASLFLYFEIQHHLERIIGEVKQKTWDQFSVSQDMEVELSSSELASSTKSEENLLRIVDILLSYQPFFPPDRASLTIPISLSMDLLTPKVKVLVEMLLEYHRPGFQGVIFVEQRQVASALSIVLPALPDLRAKDIRFAFFIGTGVNKNGVSEQSYLCHSNSGDPVKLFKEGKINILIATAVAEEGLHFKDCDLVVRFDPIPHMVSYIQSRGRARKGESRFIAMIEENDVVQMERYQNFQNYEKEAYHLYQTRILEQETDKEDDDDDMLDPADFMARERYVVQSTGAVLTYNNSLDLLHRLCSVIPRDAFTAPHIPKYGGEFIATVELPIALPLVSTDLFFSGPIRQSKKEAKRAVAFKAVKRLIELEVFDDYLLPVSSNDLDVAELSRLKTPNIPVILKVEVRDPWLIGDILWIQTIMINDEAVAGLVSGTKFPPENMIVGGNRVKTLAAKRLYFEPDTEHEQRLSMNEFTKFGVLSRITSSPFPPRMSFYLVPITQDHDVDFGAIEQLLANPHGISDWSQISQNNYDGLLVLCRHTFDGLYLLRRIHHDLTPASVPPPGSRESKASTYREFWLGKWSKPNRPAAVPCDGPVIETMLISRVNSSSYSLPPLTDVRLTKETLSVDVSRFLPQHSCSWLPISASMFQTFQILPVLCQRITHIYRARQAKAELFLPPISNNLVIEALTIPSASFPFSNQRLETLGDAVLQICTTVHLLNQYPSRHEGQLTKLRQIYVSNQYLLHRALDMGLERFVNCEIPSVFKWRYTLSESEDNFSMRNVISLEFPRRSLQDCMEAILGASFLAGGISLALSTGSVLGMEFGGPLSWTLRYRQDVQRCPSTLIYASIEDGLGYKFSNHLLIKESLTHPSLTFSEVPSYQRLEFLGDAILELVVVKYLYDKFPQASSHQLSFTRAKAICSATLAKVAVKLGLHKMILANNFELSSAIDSYVPLLEGVSSEELIKNVWKYDPPKVLSDVFESVVGAVLVDSSYNYDKTAAVVEFVMEDVLEVLSPALAKDPVSTLLEWTQGAGCTKVSFQKPKEGIVVLVHDKLIIGPIVSASMTTAKFAAAELALVMLQDSDSYNSLHRLCSCRAAMDVDNSQDASGSEDVQPDVGMDIQA